MLPGVLLLVLMRSTVAEVVFVDHYGNLITNIPGEAFLTLTGRPVRVTVGAAETTLKVRTYSEAERGTLVALVSSAGMLEIAVVQGSAADIIKIAMVRVHHRLQTEGLQSKLILQVHDELLLEVKRSEVEIVRELVQKEMETAVELSVPLTTDLHMAETWYDAK